MTSALKAMDDPRKIVAVHFTLCAGSPRKHVALDISSFPTTFDMPNPPKETFRYNFHGLAVELTPGEVRGAVSPGGSFDLYECTPRFDPAQFPSLRERWRRQLKIDEPSPTTQP